jgi:hypothetical protein
MHDLMVERDRGRPSSALCLRMVLWKSAVQAATLIRASTRVAKC